MNRAEAVEINETYQRLRTAAKGNAPVTRQAAAQFSSDLARWREWQTSGYELPRLPRRIRVGLAKPVRMKKSLPRKNKLQKCSKKPTPDIKSVTELVSQEEARELVAANRDTCIAIAQAIIGRSALAEECVAACFLSAFEQIAGNKVAFVSADKVGGWVRQIVRYQARRVMRKHVYVAASDMDFNVADRPLDSDIEDEVPIGDVWADDLAYRTVGISKRCPVADDQ